MRKSKRLLRIQMAFSAAIKTLIIIKRIKTIKRKEKKRKKNLKDSN
jgi:hypothetical protein